MNLCWGCWKKRTYDFYTSVMRDGVQLLGVGKAPICKTCVESMRSRGIIVTA